MHLTARTARRLLTVPMLAAGAALLPSCNRSTDSSPGSTISGSYVGRVANSDAFVVVVTNGTDVRAYICDGAANGQITVSEWFKGTVTGRDVQLTSERGTATLTLELTSGTATGTVRLPNNVTRTFAAPRDDGTGGFYLFKNPRGSDFYWAGWIVLPSGEQRGSVLVGTSVTANTSLNVSTQTATISGVGTVTAGKLTVSRVAQGFQGCYPCLQCC